MARESDPPLPPFAGHRGPVSGVAFDQSGKWLAVSGYGRSVRLIDVALGVQLPERLIGHRDWVTAVAFDNRPGVRGDPEAGKRLASSSADGTARIWDVAERRVIHQLEAHTDWVRGVAWSPDGALLATASRDGTVRLWDAATGEEEAPSPLIIRRRMMNVVAFSPDGRHLAVAGDSPEVQLVPVDGSGSGRSLDFPTLDKHGKWVRSLAFSPDSQRLATVDSEAVLRVWTAGSATPLTERAYAARSVAFASNDELVVGQKNGRVSVLRLGGHRPRWEHIDFTGSDVLVSTVSVSPDRRWLATGGDDDTVRLWSYGDPHDGARSRPKSVMLHVGGVRAVAYSPDDKLLASGGLDRHVRVWDAVTGTLKHDLKGHTGWVNAVAFSPGGRYLATASGDRTAALWDLRTDRCLEVFEESKEYVRSVAFSPDSSTLALTGTDGEVRLWNIASLTRRERILRRRGEHWHYIERGQSNRVLPVRHDGQANSVAFNQDGNLLASCGNDGNVQVFAFDHSTLGAQLWDKPVTRSTRINCVAFSPDGQRLAGCDAANVIRLWNTATGRLEREWKGHDDWVSALAFTKDGALLATSSADRTVRLWHVPDGAPHRRLVGHTDVVRCVAFNNAGTRLASAGGDGTIRIWDVATGRQVAGTSVADTTVRASGPVRLAGLRPDVAATEDFIGIQSDVRTLAELIAAERTKLPLAIALIGPWGSGKSSFLTQLAEKVGDFAKEGRNNIGSSPFLADIRQVHFNAWHFSDDYVWVGIAEALFAALSMSESDEYKPATPADLLESTRQKIVAAKAEQRAREFSAAVDAPAPSWSGLLGSLLRSYRRWSWSAAVVAICAGVALFVVPGRWWHVSGAFLTAAGAAASALLSRFRRPAQKARKTVAKQGAMKTALLKFVKTERDKARATALYATARAAELDRLAGLADFVARAKHDPVYASHRGLIGVIRDHLNELSRRLVDANRQWQRHQESDVPIQRIVLYIDDLDRCPPRRVADVLAAVHLMLAFPVFAVVVAADRDWLLSCLRRYREDIVGMPAAEANNTDLLDFLDKVFQIPFGLRPMDGQGASDYLSRLLERPIAEPPTAPPGDDAVAKVPSAGPDPAFTTAAATKISIVTGRGDGGGRHVTSSVEKVTDGATNAVAPSASDEAGGDGQRRSVLRRIADAASAARNTADARSTAESDPGPDDDQDLAGTARTDVKAWWQGQDAPDESWEPRELTLTDEEAGALADLGPLTPKPRAGKKLLNLYRLVRIGMSADETRTYLEKRHYVVTQVLLAILVGDPESALATFDAACLAPDLSALTAVVRERMSTPAGAPAGWRERVLERFEGLDPEAALHAAQYWSVDLRRYSFHTASPLAMDTSPESRGIALGGVPSARAGSAVDATEPEAPAGTGTTA